VLASLITLQRLCELCSVGQVIRVCGSVSVDCRSTAVDEDCLSSGQSETFHRTVVSYRTYKYTGAITRKSTRTPCRRAIGERVTQRTSLTSRLSSIRCDPALIQFCFSSPCCFACLLPDLWCSSAPSAPHTTQLVASTVLPLHCSLATPTPSQSKPNLTLGRRCHHWRYSARTTLV
jgi:hypothetical protein